MNVLSRMRILFYDWSCKLSEQGGICFGSR